MANDITGFGLVVNIIASNTFPAGIAITQFSDDADAVDIASIKIADTAMGLNGDLVKWSKANPNPVVLNVIPNSLDDVNLSILANANRVSQGKNSANDLITMTIVYPDGTVRSYSNGFITDAPFGTSVASAGRMKTKAYAFSFESNVGAG